jgi:UDP-N-acetylglucosamine acyltransferase
VPPFCIVQGDRAELTGLNTVGLQRHGFSEEAQARLKDAYRILFRSKLPLEDAVGRVRMEYGGHAEVDTLLDFVTTSTRGLTR